LESLKRLLPHCCASLAESPFHFGVRRWLVGRFFSGTDHANAIGGIQLVVGCGCCLSPCWRGNNEKQEKCAKASYGADR